MRFVNAGNANADSAHVANLGTMKVVAGENACMNGMTSVGKSFGITADAGAIHLNG